MTKHLEEFLNLPSLDDIMEAQTEGEKAPDESETTEDFEELSFTPSVEPSSIHAEKIEYEKSMDDLHTEMLQHSRELMDLGFNIDIRSARGIFEVAASMYKNAMDAKNAKTDAQFKAMKLELDNRKAKLAEAMARGEDGEPLGSETLIVEDRNEIIRELMLQAKKNAS